MDVCSIIPLHRRGVAGDFERWMLGQPFVVNQMELLLESRHASFEMHFQPSAVVHGIKLHTLWYRTPLIGAGDHIGEALRVAGREVLSATRRTVVIGQVAGAKCIFPDVVIDRRLLLCVRSLAFHHDRFDQCLEILSPELGALFRTSVEGNPLGYADQLHILQRDDFMFHTFSFLC